MSLPFCSLRITLPSFDGPERRYILYPSIYTTPFASTVLGKLFDSCGLASTVTECYWYLVHPLEIQPQIHHDYEEHQEDPHDLSHLICHFSQEDSFLKEREVSKWEMN